METTIEHNQNTFQLHLSKDLLERLEAEAHYEKRSLNNLVERLLDEALKRRPNADTLAAIEEARSGKYAGTVDTSSMEAFIKSIEG